MTSGLVSIGVAGSLGPVAIADIAVAAEAAGFHALWVNDTLDGDSLAALAAVASVTSRLTLATGVVPVDRRPARELVAVVRDLPQERLVLGIGSGGAGAGALTLMREAVVELRAATTARVLVGALGPRMRALAATDADGSLLSWLTPGLAAEQATGPWTALYVRTALDAAAQPRLDDEIARYASFPRYAANFARLGISAADTVLAPATFVDGVGRYREAVDEVVLRAITPDDAVAAYAEFVACAAIETKRCDR